MKKITIKNENRKALLAYIEMQAEIKRLEKESKALRAELADTFKTLGDTFNATDKTSFVYGTVQQGGQAVNVVYQETTAKGAVDWKAYALALGGTDEGAEAFRRASNTRVSIGYASKAENKAITEYEQVDA